MDEELLYIVVVLIRALYEKQYSLCEVLYLVGIVYYHVFV